MEVLNLYSIKGAISHGNCDKKLAEHYNFSDRIVEFCRNGLFG